MSRRAWTAILSLGLLLAPYGLAAEDETGEVTHVENVGQVRDGYVLKEGPKMSPEARVIGDPDHPEPPPEGWFGPDPSYEDATYDAEAQIAIYGAKHLNPTAQPIVELGRRLYDRGSYVASATWLGKENPIASHLMVYGDWRTAFVYTDDGVAGANGDTHQATVATRLNLDIDWKLTATERLHAFVRPFDMGGSSLRYDIDGKVRNEFFEEFDFNLETLYFEGDVGAIIRGWTNEAQGYDLPIAFGLVPMVTQNGIWIEDAFWGAAFALTAKNSPNLKISNYDITFFAGFDKVTSAAVADDHDASLFGLAGFMDLLEGYVEYGYGYVDAPTNDLSYHNVTISFSKRYAGTLSNSVRLIGNFGQSPVAGQPKTADGVLLLLENSLITSKPSTLIPYFNLFAGFDTPQSLARATASGGVLRNTGINFETDGMTSFSTLDASGHDSYGGAIGVNYLFSLNRQLVVEAAVVERMSDSLLGSEYALGVRFQEPLNNAWILRFDAMGGKRDGVGEEDIFGLRLEIRRKF